MATCCVCKAREGEIYPKLSQILKKPVCQVCLNGKGAYRNTQREGLASHLPSFSIEFEVHGSPSACERALALLECGYLRTEDGSVSDEYKSPIYNSLAALRPHLPVLDGLSDLVDECCGTHLHIGFPSPFSRRLREMRKKIFTPLVEYLEDDDVLTEQFWGRYFCDYADTSFSDEYPWLRFPTRYDTLEYRLPCFRSAAQYLEVVRLCRKTTYMLQQSLTALENMGDPYGERIEAARLELTPIQLGDRLLRFYQEAWRRIDQVRLRKAGVVQLPLAAS